jgi:hemerythrin-like domain-containing protein
MMEELIDEHRQGRETIRRLAEACNLYSEGDTSAADDVRAELRWLGEFYPRHIEKEDKHFFLPVMKHFTEQEREAMLGEEYEFDRKLIHEVYGRIVEGFEER